MKAVIYTRTATEVQTSNNLEIQKNILTTYCADNQIEIVKHFEEIFSGMTLNRPELSKLIDFVIITKIDKILVTSWNRLGRDFTAVSEMISRLSAMIVEVETIDNSEFTFFNFLISN